MENLGIVVGIVATIAAGLVWVITLLIKKERHEDMQDNRIENQSHEITNLIVKVDNLENREKNRDLAILEIKTEMQHTQTMIQHLGENHQESFIKLIDLIEKIDSNRSK